MSQLLKLVDDIINYVDTYSIVKNSNDDVKSDNDVLDLVDTHIHLWDVDTIKSRNWLSTAGLEDINKTYNINTYTNMYKNNPQINLKYGIFMETDVADNDIDNEINEITEICRNPNNNLRGIIIKLDPSKPTNEFKKLITKLKSNKYIVGFRRVLLNNNYPHNIIPQQWIDNLLYLQSINDIKWVCDIVINIKLLLTIEPLLRALPNMQFMLDHMGNHHQINKSNKDLLKIWKENIQKLSKYNNLNVKLSGLTGGQPGLKNDVKWRFEDEMYKIDFILKNFNQNNIVYGCDWPVSLIPLQANERNEFLNKWPLNLYKYLKQNYSKQLCDKVFVQNAVRIYNLQL